MAEDLRNAFGEFHFCKGFIDRKYDIGDDGKRVGLDIATGSSGKTFYPPVTMIGPLGEGDRVGVIYEEYTRKDDDGIVRQKLRPLFIGTPQEAVRELVKRVAPERSQQSGRAA